MALFGSRVLKFEAKLGGVDNLEELVRLTAQNLAKEIRNESMLDAINLLEARAVHYIREGKREARTPTSNPRSYGLEQSFKATFSESDTARVEMGTGVPYARIHNLPIGAYQVIYARPNKMLHFIWYRMGDDYQVFAQSVSKPGIAYWTRALEDVRVALPGIIRKYIEYFGRGDTRIHRQTGARLRGHYRGGKALHQTASRRIRSI